METNDRSAKALSNKLWEVIEGLESKTIKPSEAKEITNAAGKIIQIALSQLQANTMGAHVAVDLLDIPEGTISLPKAHNKKLRQLT